MMEEECLYCFTDILDNELTCNSRSVVTRWLEDTDNVIVSGKTNAESTFRECNIKLGPTTYSTKKMMKVFFETYYNQDCGVFISAQQSPTTFFDSDVKTMVSFEFQNELVKYCL